MCVIADNHSHHPLVFGCSPIGICLASDDSPLAASMGAFSVDPKDRQTQSGTGDAGHTHGGEQRAKRKPIGLVKPS